MLTLGGVFLAIHIGRMPISDTLLGIISPFVATAGDLLMTLVFATLVVLPWRLLWRRFTRPAERLAWSLHVGVTAASAPMNPAADWLITRWLEEPLRLQHAAARSARLTSCHAHSPHAPRPAGDRLFRGLQPDLGLQLVLQHGKLGDRRLSEDDGTAGRSVADQHDRRGRRALTAAGDELFRIRPDGVDGAGDFSFIVIGDPGEGDASQYSLISRYLKLGLHDDVKFLVVSSDVIYPAGSMQDYEANFYLPFQGFAKPIYAIPGNHDWFDALEGFNANFLEPKAARAAIEARVEADLGLTSTNARRIDRLMAEAARLRRLYGVNVGTQRAVFFELQTADFALLAIDTGILRTVDQRQWAWIERALDRSRGKFIMAIVGHPRFAGGHDIPPIAEGHDVVRTLANKFAALYRLLANHNVRIAMAGDTHDFEYYREKISRRWRRARDASLRQWWRRSLSQHRHGARLSETARRRATGRSIRGPTACASKMDAEMPLWKQPFWYWIKWFKAWPFSVEALSGLFDFNHAPFFQSFMEVRVERSKKRVVLVLNGVDGPLRWRDLQTGGALLPAGASARRSGRIHRADGRPVGAEGMPDRSSREMSCVPTGGCRCRKLMLGRNGDTVRHEGDPRHFSQCGAALQ